MDFHPNTYVSSFPSTILMPYKNKYTPTLRSSQELIGSNVV